VCSVCRDYEVKGEFSLMQKALIDLYIDKLRTKLAGISVKDFVGEIAVKLHIVRGNVSNGTVEQKESIKV